MVQSGGGRIEREPDKGIPRQSEKKRQAECKRKRKSKDEERYREEWREGKNDATIVGSIFHHWRPTGYQNGISRSLERRTWALVICSQSSTASQMPCKNKYLNILRRSLTSLNWIISLRRSPLPKCQKSVGLGEPLSPRHASLPLALPTPCTICWHRVCPQAPAFSSATLSAERAGTRCTRIKPQTHTGNRTGHRAREPILFMWCQRRVTLISYQGCCRPLSHCWCYESITSLAFSFPMWCTVTPKVEIHSQGQNS